MSSGRAHRPQDLDGLAGARAGVRRDADVERLALPHQGVERPERLLERRGLVEPVAVEDVDVVQAHPLQGLLARGDEVLPRPAALAVGAGPHVVAGLARDDQLVAVGPEVAREGGAEVALGRAVGRAVVVREVEVRHAAVEGPAQGRLLALERHVVAEVVPEAEGDGRQVEPGAADPAVRHPCPVASGGGLVLVSVEGHGHILPDSLRIAHAQRPLSRVSGWYLAMGRDRGVRRAGVGGDRHPLPSYISDRS